MPGRQTPPLLASFDSIESFERAARGFIHTEELDTIKGLVERGLPPATSVRAIALLFGFSPRFVTAICRRPGRYYREFEIPRGHGRTRKIAAPKVALKVIQTWIGHHVARATDWPDCVHGFVPQRSIITAAQAHCPADVVVSLDIRDFFGSITRQQVQASFVHLGYPDFSAHMLGILCSLDGALPQGSPASPALANHVFQEIDLKLVGEHQANGERYTRYADDLVFSWQGDKPGLSDTIKARVPALLRDSGFNVAEEKVIVQRAPAQLTVHGLLVNGPKPRLRKRYRNRIRLYRHLLEIGELSVARRQQLAGHVAFADSVEPQ